MLTAEKADADLGGLPALVCVDDSGTFSRLVLWRASDTDGSSWSPLG